MDKIQKSIECRVVFDDPSLPLCVVVAATRWDEPPRIRHQITRQLLRWSNVLFVELFPTETTSGSKFERISDRLMIWRPGRLTRFSRSTVARVPWLTPKVNRRFATMLSRLLAKFPACTKLLFNFIHTNDAVMKVSGFDDRTYICFDEFPCMWREASCPPLWKYLLRSKVFQYYENRVARAAERCLAVHIPLKEKLLRVNSNTHLFLQATELPAITRESDLQRPNGTRPIRVAYMGYLTYNQLIGWLERVHLEDDMELWLIGPQDHKFDRERKLKERGVNFTGILEGEELAEKLAWMDVLTMAYNPAIPEVSVQTASNKFFQYLSAGRPVVISDMKYYLEVPDGVLYRASSPDEFVAEIRRAHESDCREFRDLRRKIAAENTWDQRGEELHGYLKSALGDRIPDLD